jgi:hypothetical protein
VPNPQGVPYLWEYKLNQLVQRAIDAGMKQPFTIQATDRHGNTVGVVPLVSHSGIEIKIEGTADSRVFLPFHAKLKDSDKPPR